MGEDAPQYKVLPHWGGGGGRTRSLMANLRLIVVKNYNGTEQI